MCDKTFDVLVDGKKVCGFVLPCLREDDGVARFSES